jgi:hypothetical protein
MQNALRLCACFSRFRAAPSTLWKYLLVSPLQPVWPRFGHVTVIDTDSETTFASMNSFTLATPAFIRQKMESI